MVFNPRHFILGQFIFPAIERHLADPGKTITEARITRPVLACLGGGERQGFDTDADKPADLSEDRPGIGEQILITDGKKLLGPVAQTVALPDTAVPFVDEAKGLGMTAPALPQDLLPGGVDRAWIAHNLDEFCFWKMREQMLRKIVIAGSFRPWDVAGSATKNSFQKPRS